MDEADKVHQARKEAALTALLAERRRPLLAAELAERCGYNQAHESNRRRIREIVAELREAGRRICAGARYPDSHGATEPRSHEGTAETAVAHVDIGYWLARDDAEWAAYLESRRANARFEFVAVRIMAGAANEKQTGQGKLFGSHEATEPRSHEAAMEWARN